MEILGEIFGILLVIGGIIFWIAIWRAVMDTDLDAPIFETKITFDFDEIIVNIKEDDKTEDKAPVKSEAKAEDIPESVAKVEYVSAPKTRPDSPQPLQICNPQDNDYHINIYPASGYTSSASENQANSTN